VPLVQVDIEPRVATITLDDPERRNALSDGMFTALEGAIAAVEGHEHGMVVRLRGRGDAFCAGFDLEACVADEELAASFIRRLSGVLRSLRRLRQVVIAEVRGPALAGGCALVSACDFVCVAETAQLGYPVHRIGISPSVSLPTLMASIGGGARPFQLLGELVDGRTALAMGLATHCSADPTADADAFCARLVEKGPRALAATKRWLNELDGSDRDDHFDATAEGSAVLCRGDEARRMLRSFWSRRRDAAQRS
jgi:methylglutaconyl-CoA hydratase